MDWLTHEATGVTTIGLLLIVNMGKWLVLPQTQKLRTPASIIRYPIITNDHRFDNIFHWD